MPDNLIEVPSANYSKEQQAVRRKQLELTDSLTRQGLTRTIPPDYSRRPGQPRPKARHGHLRQCSG